MRVLVVDTYYPAFLREHDARHPALARAGYDEQHAALMARHFGTGEVARQSQREPEVVQTKLF